MRQGIQDMHQLQELVQLHRLGHRLCNDNYSGRFRDNYFGRLEQGWSEPIATRQVHQIAEMDESLLAFLRLRGLDETS